MRTSETYESIQTLSSTRFLLRAERSPFCLREARLKTPTDMQMRAYADTPVQYLQKMITKYVVNASTGYTTRVTRPQGSCGAKTKTLAARARSYRNLNQRNAIAIGQETVIFPVVCRPHDGV